MHLSRSESMKQHLQNVSARASSRSYSQSNFTHTSIKIVRSRMNSKDGGSQIAMAQDGDDSSEGSEFDYVKLLNLGGGSNSSQQQLQNNSYS